MISLSLCMIVKNEEEVLARCLECIKKIVDEIIIVDTGSTDKSKEIAKKYTNQVYDFVWTDNFSEARNFSFSKATKEYIMWLDADDILMPKAQVDLLKLKQVLKPEVDVVYMPYHMTKGSGNNEIDAIFWRERIVKREKGFKWEGILHEHIISSGKLVKVDIAVTHMKMHSVGDRNLKIFESYLAKGNKISDKEAFYYARELFVNGQIDKAIKYYKIFLKTRNALRSNYLNACIELSDCYAIKGDNENCLKALLQYFEIDVPRAEICCKIGHYYKVRDEFEKAIAWYSLAPYTIKPEESIGMIKPMYWDYVPYMEIVICYYKLGDLEQAIYYNEKAAKIKSNDEKVLANRYILAKEKLNRINKE